MHDSVFSPCIWPEDPVPNELANCQKCELHLQRTRVIWGEGNLTAPILVLLDNPGAREDKEGNSFLCATRQTLQLAAYEAGLKMDDLYVTYVLKCRPLRRYDKETARKTCLVHLREQLQSKKLKLAFCLGNTAVQWFFGNLELEVKNLRGVWYNVQGLPTAVTYHPLAIRRRPNLARQFAEDWAMLAESYKKL